MTGQSDKSARIRRALTAAVLLLLAGGAAYALLPRHADLRAFDPDSMGRREAAMWRYYYEKRYAALARELYLSARVDQGFSPFDSARIAWAASRAAREFQPSRSRPEALRALPSLVTYFRLLARAAPVKVDVDEAARTELAWWEARRWAVTPTEYGQLIAHVATLLYGVDNTDIRHAGVLRAHAMAFRDLRGQDISDADWTTITGALQRSYRLLKKGIEPGAES